MHKNGLKLLRIEIPDENVDNHLEHHTKTYLTQYNTGPEQALVFNLFTLHIIILTTFILIIFSICWYIIPPLHCCIPYDIYIILVVFCILFYYWCWGSIHSAYHSRKITISNQIAYNLVPYFTPDVNSPIYKYLFTYHSLHHLNKGESKGNYNIVCPLFDHIFQTYTPRVDNRLHFSKNLPKTKQEEWLSKHLVFDIRAFDNNQLKYKLESGTEWILFPDDI